MHSYVTFLLHMKVLMYDMAIAVVHVCLEYTQERKAAGSDRGRLRLL